MNLQNVLNVLRTKRRLFHSEADFQHALAWETQSMYPEARVRLEYPWGTVAGKRAAIDILVTAAGNVIPIELKYAKRELHIEEAGEWYRLPNQSAEDQKRYKFVYDISRVEGFVKATPGSPKGYVLWLTNNLALTKPPRKDDVCDFAFRIHDGAVVQGSMQWGDTAGPGTTKGHEEPITLEKQYTISWHTYSDFGVRNGLFKYALIEVHAL